jgi:tetratricopeptide (TPR) repeat protein
MNFSRAATALPFFFLQRRMHNEAMLRRCVWVLCLTGGVSLSQVTGLAVVEGKVLAQDGKPLAGITVILLGEENGRRYKFKTDSHGEYRSEFVQPGFYDALYQRPDGSEFWRTDRVPIVLKTDRDTHGVQIVLDLKAKMNDPTVQRVGGATPEQLQAKQSALAESETLSGFDRLLAKVTDAEQAGQYADAAAELAPVAAHNPDRDLLWLRLGQAYLEWGKRDRQAIHFQQAEEALKNAIKAAQQPGAAALGRPEMLGAMHSELGEALGHIGKPDEAIAEFESAAHVDAGQADTYFYNEGAIYTNAGRPEEAIDAFNRAIKHNPGNADAIFGRATQLIAQSVTAGHGAAVPAAAADALRQYLQLQPTGTHAAQARELLGTVPADQNGQRH